MVELRIIKKLLVYHDGCEFVFAPGCTVTIERGLAAKILASMPGAAELIREVPDEPAAPAAAESVTAEPAIRPAGEDTQSFADVVPDKRLKGRRTRRK